MNSLRGQTVLREMELALGGGMAGSGEEVVEVELVELVLDLKTFKKQPRGDALFSSLDPSLPSSSSSTSLALPGRPLLVIQGLGCLASDQGRLRLGGQT